MSLTDFNLKELERRWCQCLSRCWIELSQEFITDLPMHGTQQLKQLLPKQAGRIVATNLYNLKHLGRSVAVALQAGQPELCTFF